MSCDPILQQAEFYLRAYLHTVVPLHRRLVKAMCTSPAPPLELATTLENIGYEHLGMASELAKELLRRGRMDDEPDPDEYAEARIDRFVEDLFARAGDVRFSDGTELDARTALEAMPVVKQSIRTALLTARSNAAPGGAVS